jgi:cytochrome c556
MKRTILAVSISVFAVGFALAHSGATGIVKERMMAMKEIAAATKSIAQQDWGNVEAARVEIKKNAEVLNKHASEIVALFPQGSIKGPSEAIPAIWERPEEFQRIVTVLETASAQLADVSVTASSKSDIEPVFQQIAGTCKGCHQDFRQKK